MDYTHLTSEQRTTLRHERIMSLEADHYRTSLLLAELPADAPSAQRESMQADLTDLERRLAVHCGPGTAPAPDVAPAATNGRAPAAERAEHAAR